MTLQKTPDWTLLDTADIDQAAGRAALRQGIIKPLVMRGDYRRAISILEVIVENGDEKQDYLQLARLEGQAGHPEKAFETLRAALRNQPGDLDISRAYLAASLKLDDVHVADAAARELMHLWDKDGSIADSATKALYRAGDIPAALDAADVSIRLNESDSAAITFAASVYNTAGQATRARAALVREGGATSQPQTGKRAFELARALYQLDPAADDARLFLKNCYDAEPQNYRYAHLFSNCLYSRGEYQAALEVIEAARTMERSFVAAVLYAKCLRQLRRYDEAVAVLDPIVEAPDVAESVLRFATGVYLLAGDARKADTLDARSKSSAKRRIPSNLMTALDGLSARLPQADIRQARLDWSWQHVRASAKVPVDQQAWEDQVRWINLADNLFRDCLEHVPSEIGAIADLIDGTAENTRVLTEARREERGVILATAHVGALFAGPVALAETGLPVSIVASTPDVDGGRVSAYENARLISATSNDVLSLTRTILRHLAENRVVVIAIDGTSFPGMPRYDLFDRSIALSDFVPRRVFKANVPSFYTDVRWLNGRLHAELTQMPVPVDQDSEAEDKFVAQWMRAYVTEIEHLFGNSSHNLRMSGGFWNTIKM
ncbi:CDC27 family protein [Cognatiyoonia sp. IB215182]|uniref:CDC27 family protein n=1 Tax=Cognatiyoonia sp. IB215182 TaxID=3097353 RepID=UPI002A0C1496|nr:CDC27 family protein [Cognatiyoonia sp. IB215182]MDX8354316.1 CDC27 family protein [Cognatiyoonia sp. IB215182]